MRKIMAEMCYQFRYALPMWLIGLLTNFWPDNRVTIKIRGTLLKPFLKKCGRNFTVGKIVTFCNPNNIEIGDDVYVAIGSWLDGIGGLTIDSEVKISPYVIITTSSHCFKDNSVRFGGSRRAPVTIGKGCWLASHAVVAAGVSVGAGSVVGANAVVTHNIPENIFAGGIPAKVLGPRVDKEPDIFERFN
jgi:acetyltransferase-like isoleucine patch superfamily enzyme